MTWQEKAKTIADKIQKYREDAEGWKQAKKNVSFFIFRALKNPILFFLSNNCAFGFTLYQTLKLGI